jgi:hypothetical protein
MGDLYAGNGTLLLQKANDGRQGVGLDIVPDAQILWRYATFRTYRRCLHQNEACSAHGTTAQVHPVPVSGDAIGSRILAHGGHYDPVA